MNQYESAKTYQFPLHPEVAKIYNFGVGVAFRFMKAKKDMLYCLKKNVKDHKWEGKINNSVKKRAETEPK